jgi:hypothetical protein
MIGAANSCWHSGTVKQYHARVAKCQAREDAMRWLVVSGALRYVVHASDATAGCITLLSGVGVWGPGAT